MKGFIGRLLQGSITKAKLEDEKWLRATADKENGQFISAGGLVTELKVRAEKESLTGYWFDNYKALMADRDHWRMEYECKKKEHADYRHEMREELKCTYERAVAAEEKLEVVRGGAKLAFSSACETSEEWQQRAESAESERDIAIQALLAVKVRIAFIGWPTEDKWEVEPGHFITDWRSEIASLELALQGHYERSKAARL